MKTEGRAKDLQQYLEGELPQALEMLRHMVGINSFTANKDGVDALGEFTAGCFRELGFAAERVPSASARYGDHRVLTRKGQSGRVVGLVSHLDTVFPPEEEERNQFRWRQEGEKIYGPGTMDIKGGTVVIHMMLSALRAHYAHWFEEITWVILLNSSEEVLSSDFTGLCQQRIGAGAEAILVFEAGGSRGAMNTLVTARKGRATFRVSAEGRGAHAGSHHRRGINAVVQLAEVVQRLAAITDYAQEVTVNAGNFRGGTVVNRVPHEAAAEIEMRAFGADEFERAVQAILALDGYSTVQSPADGAACVVRVELEERTPPWPPNRGTQNLFETWQAVANEAGIPLASEERGGLSDGNFLWSFAPAIDGLGPAGDNAHCSEASADGSKEPEYVRASSFVPKALLNTLAIVRWLEQSSRSTTNRVLI